MQVLQVSCIKRRDVPDGGVNLKPERAARNVRTQEPFLRSNSHMDRFVHISHISCISYSHPANASFCKGNVVVCVRGHRAVLNIPSHLPQTQTKKSAMDAKDPLKTSFISPSRQTQNGTSPVLRATNAIRLWMRVEHAL